MLLGQQVLRAGPPPPSAAPCTLHACSTHEPACPCCPALHPPGRPGGPPHLLHHGRPAAPAGGGRHLHPDLRGCVGGARPGGRPAGGAGAAGRRRASAWPGRGRRAGALPLARLRCCAPCRQPAQGGEHGEADHRLQLGPLGCVLHNRCWRGARGPPGMLRAWLGQASRAGAAGAPAAHSLAAEPSRPAAALMPAQAPAAPPGPACAWPTCCACAACTAWSRAPRTCGSAAPRVRPPVLRGPRRPPAPLPRASFLPARPL